MVFFSYRAKHELLAGNQFWKFSRQCSLFGRIGDQSVAISNPVRVTNWARLKAHNNWALASMPTLTDYM